MTRSMIVLPPAKVERDLATGVIEIAPLAFMRGRTLAHSFVILDEAQNTTSMQMKMFLTRIGEGSKMAVTGDPSQVDLPTGQRSGLEEAVGLLAGVEGIEAVRFTSADVVRRDLVARIVEAYDKAKLRTHCSHEHSRRQYVLHSGVRARRRARASGNSAHLDRARGGDWSGFAAPRRQSTRPPRRWRRIATVQARAAARPASCSPAMRWCAA